MEIKIPYNPGLRLGQWVNTKTLTPVTTEDTNVSPTNVKEVKKLTKQFSFIENMEDVCRVLSVPPEYVLKVKAKIIPDKVVEACLQNLGQPNSFTLVFKATYEARKEEKTSNEAADRLSKPKFEETSVDLEQATHWINSVTLGQDLVIVVSFTDKDKGTSSKLRKKLIKKCFGSHFGCLDGTKLDSLKHKASKFNNLFSENLVDCFYFSFSQLDEYPTKWSGVINVLDKFCDQCTVWNISTEEKNHMFPVKVYSGDRMAVHVTNAPEKGIEPTNFFKDFLKNPIKTASSFFSSLGKTEPKATSQQTVTSLNDGEGQDFVVLHSSVLTQVHSLEFTLQPLKTDLTLQRTGQAVNFKLYDIILKQLLSCQKADDLIKDFKEKVEHGEIHITEFQRQEIGQCQTINNNVTNDIVDLIAVIDFKTPLRESSVQRVCKINTLEEVLKLIKKCTFELPPGEELDLLLIGKTGHGKSSTGNSILFREQFRCSSDSESRTIDPEVGYSETDGRVLRIVDTPGICDTRLSKPEFLVNAFAFFSKTIAASPKGFHALIFVFNFPGRFTDEEKYCMKMLKGILGDNIIKDHGVCLFTGGDQFMAQMIKEKKNWSFKQWCQEQKGNIRELFEECQYRCLQFDNLTDDADIKKAQLVQLVALVDSKINSSPYTNASFDLASKERQKLYAEMKLETDVFRDVQLLLDSVNKMQSSSSSLEEKHLNLSKIDHLSKTLTEIALKSENIVLKTFLDSTNKLTENIKHSEDEYQMKLNEAQKSIKEFEQRSTELAVSLNEKDELLKQKEEEINYQIEKTAKINTISNDIQEITDSVRSADEKKLINLNQKLSLMKEDTSYLAEGYVRSCFAVAETSISDAKSKEDKMRKEMREKKRKRKRNQKLKRMEKVKLEKEILEYKKLEQEKHEKERLEYEKREQEKHEKERLEYEKREQVKREKERLEYEKREQAIREKERLQIEEREKRKQDDTLKITKNVLEIMKSVKTAKPQDLLQLEETLNKVKIAAEKIDSDGFKKFFKDAEELFETVRQQHKNIQTKAATSFSDIKSNASKVNDIESKTTGQVAELVNTLEQSSDGSCFPASSTVTLISGKVVNIGVLEVGDKVLVLDQNNQLTYDTVYMFGHRENNVLGEFISLKTSSCKVLVTSDHFVFVIRKDEKVSLAARNVRVGDCLLVATSEGLHPEQVEAITLEQELGLFAPFTNSGTIIINGALVSCYVDVLPHLTCHTCLWPMRQLYKVSPSALVFINGSPAQTPIPAWARAFLKLQKAKRTVTFLRKF